MVQPIYTRSTGVQAYTAFNQLDGSRDVVFSSQGHAVKPDGQIFLNPLLKTIALDEVTTYRYAAQLDVADHKITVVSTKKLSSSADVPEGQHLIEYKRNHDNPEQSMLTLHVRNAEGSSTRILIDQLDQEKSNHFGTDSMRNYLKAWWDGYDQNVIGYELFASGCELDGNNQCTANRWAAHGKFVGKADDPRIGELTLTRQSNQGAIRN